MHDLAQGDCPVKAMSEVSTVPFCVKTSFACVAATFFGVTTPFQHSFFLSYTTLHVSYSTYTLTNSYFPQFKQALKLSRLVKYNLVGNPKRRVFSWYVLTRLIDILVNRIRFDKRACSYKRTLSTSCAVNTI